MKFLPLYGAFLLLGISHAAVAQENVLTKPAPNKADKPHVSVGLRLGGSLSNFYSSEFADILAKTVEGNKGSLEAFTQQVVVNPSVGLTLAFHFNRHISFSPEVMWAIVGEKNKYQFRFKTNTQDVNNFTELNYVQIPLLFEFAFGRTSVQPFVKVGATPAYLFKSKWKVTTTNSNGNNTPDVDEDLNSALSRIDGGPTLGAGVHLGRVFDIETRYNIGLFALSNDVNSFFHNVKSQAFSLTLGVKF